jgi:AcrR family transcriptional regulator
VPAQPLDSPAEGSASDVSATIAGEATQPAARRRVAREERERQMLSTAERVFAERGFQGTSMDDIADLVGVSKPMLYEYFGSKEGLLRGCIGRVREELRAVTAAALADGDEPYATLRRALLAYFAYIERRRTAWTMLLHEPMYLVGDAGAEIEALRQQQTRLIVAHILRFWPTAPELDVSAFAEMVVGACERIALWRGRHPDVTSARAADLVSAFAWPGLATLTGSRAKEN